MKRLPPVFLSVLLLGVRAVSAGDIEIKDPWVRAVPPSSSSTAAFLVILNKADQPAALVACASPVAREVKPMVTTKQANGMLGMEFAERFLIPAGKRRVLEPGADHLMLMRLKSVPKAGTTVPLVLIFESAGKRQEIKLDAPVR